MFPNQVHAFQEATKWEECVWCMKHKDNCILILIIYFLDVNCILTIFTLDYNLGLIS